MNYPTLVFDVGGTLIHFDPDKLALAYSEAARARGIMLDSKWVRAMILELEHELPTRTRERLLSLEEDFGITFWDDFYADGFHRLGIKDDLSKEVSEIRERFMRGEFEVLFDDVLPALESLTRQGVPLGILSNFSPNLEELLRGFGIHDYFRFFVISAIARVEKPDKKIFDLAVAAASRPPEQVIYIGDSIFHDMEGARLAGLMGILIDRDNRHSDYAGVRLTSLNDLIPLIEKELNAVQA